MKDYKKLENEFWLMCVLCFVVVVFGMTQQCSAQEYVSFSFDTNKALHLKDNSRTINDVYGLDYDFEVGAIDKNIGVYMFYGSFNNSNYKNYGVGLDYIFKPLENISLSLGNFYHVVIRTKEQRYLGTTSSYFNPRGKISYDLSCIIIDLIAKLTDRNDIDKTVFEGQIGITKKFKK